MISVQRGLEWTTTVTGELSVHRCKARPCIPFSLTRLTNLDYLDSLIIHTSLSILGLEEIVHAEQPWLSLLSSLCLFVSRLCSRLTMWWLTRSTATRRWGWLPRPLHLTWTETPQTAPTETWTWKMSPGFAWSSFRRTPMSPWWVDTHYAGF